MTISNGSMKPPLWAASIGKSILTIAATGAADSSEGCFRPRKPRSEDIIKLPFHEYPGFSKADGFITLVPMQDGFAKRVLQSTWNTRGWILQERLLSTRLIHFSDGLTFWECQTLSKGEDGKPVLMETKSSLNAFVNGTDWDWCRLVDDYTKRKLTKSEDKLIALSGLIDQRIAATADICHFGLWRSSLHTGLLWYNVSQSPRYSNRMIAPTWSWASINGSVKWESWVTEAVSLARTSVQDKSLEITTSVKYITRSTNIKDDRDLEYKATSGLIYDAGLMGIAQAILSADAADEGSPIGWAAFDEEENIGPFAAGLISKNERPFEDMGDDERDTYNVLIMQHIDGNDYERVGIGEVVAQDWFKGGDLVMIRVV